MTPGVSGLSHMSRNVRDNNINVLRVYCHSVSEFLMYRPSRTPQLHLYIMAARQEGPRPPAVPNKEVKAGEMRWTPLSRQKMVFLKVEKYTLRLVNRVRFPTGGTSTGVKLVRGLVPESLMKTLLVVEAKVGSEV